MRLAELIAGVAWCSVSSRYGFSHTAVSWEKDLEYELLLHEVKELIEEAKAKPKP